MTSKNGMRKMACRQGFRANSKASKALGALVLAGMVGCTEKKTELSEGQRHQKQCVIRALDHIPSRHGFVVKSYNVTVAEKRNAAEQLAFIPNTADEAMRISFGYKNTYEIASARFKGLTDDKLRAEFAEAILPAMTFAYNVELTMMSGTFEVTYTSVCGGSLVVNLLSRPTLWPT